MARKDTVWGAYDISLEQQLRELCKSMESAGIEKPTKKEASFIIAEKNKRFKITDVEVKSLVRKKRGIL